MKTRFEYKDLTLRISKNGCGTDRFTKEQIIEAIDNGTAIVKDHCLCRTADGKVFAEIEQ